MPELPDIFADPTTARSPEKAGWAIRLRDARRCRVLPRLSHHLQDDVRLPEPVRRQLWSGHRTADSFERQLRWQLERLSLDLRHATYPIVLLKGAGCLLDIDGLFHHFATVDPTFFSTLVPPENRGTALGVEATRVGIFHATDAKNPASAALRGPSLKSVHEEVAGR